MNDKIHYLTKMGRFNLVPFLAPQPHINHIDL